MPRSDPKAKRDDVFGACWSGAGPSWHKAPDMTNFCAPLRIDLAANELC
jgi:hypothetical protein